MFRILALAVCLSIGSQAAAQSANADLYTCKFTNTRGKILPDRVLMAQPDASDGYLVADPWLQYFEEKTAADANVLKDNSKLLNLSWNYNLSDGSGTQAKVLFTIILKRNTGKATIRSRVLGYLNHDSSRGTCSVKRGRM